MAPEATSRTIVVGVDGSAESLAALRWAADEARRRDRGLFLIHAKDLLVYGAPLTPMWGAQTLQAVDESAQAVMEQAVITANNLSPGVPVNTEILEGSAERALLDKTNEAELVVVGRRGRGGFANLLLGSTALTVARHADCPVVVVPVEDRGDVAEDLGVVAGVDTSDYSEEVLGFAFAEASLWSKKLTVFRAWFHPAHDAQELTFPLPPLPEEHAAKQEQPLTELLASWREKFPDVAVERRVVRGRPARALVKASASANLIVVGSRGEGGLYSLLLGSVADSLIRHAACPVTVVHKSDPQSQSDPTSSSDDTGSP